MALYTTASLAAYLRLETADEYPVVDMLLTSSIAQIVRYINRPIVATSASYYIKNDSSYLYGSATGLTIPSYPFDKTTLVITDTSGAVVSGSNYYAHSELGFVECTPGNTLANGPYTVTVIVGLQTDSQYATKYEPLINQAILDLVSLYFSQRNPDVKTDTQADISQTYYGQEMPPRTCTLLNSMRIPGIVR